MRTMKPYSPEDCIEEECRECIHACETILKRSRDGAQADIEPRLALHAQVHFTVCGRIFERVMERVALNVREFVPAH